MPQAGLRLPAGAQQPVVTLGPVPLPEQPEDGVALGNAYRLQVRDQDGRPAEIGTPPRPVVVQLRIPAKTDQPVAIELHRDGQWSTLQTTRAGEDDYSGYLPALGDVAAVQIQNPSRSRLYTGTTQRGVRVPIVLAGAILLVLAAALLVRRFRAPGG